MTVVQIYDIKTVPDGFHNMTIQMQFPSVLQWLLVVCLRQFHTNPLFVTIHMRGCSTSVAEAPQILKHEEFRKMKIGSGYALI
jgi:hypothetical protein